MLHTHEVAGSSPAPPTSPHLERVSHFRPPQKPPRKHVLSSQTPLRWFCCRASSPTARPTRSACMRGTSAGSPRQRVRSLPCVRRWTCSASLCIGHGDTSDVALRERAEIGFLSGTGKARPPAFPGSPVKSRVLRQGSNPDWWKEARGLPLASSSLRQPTLCRKNPQGKEVCHGRIPAGIDCRADAGIA